MVKRVLLLSLALAQFALADTYLCVAEKGAGIIQGAGKPIEAHIYDVSTMKWVMSNESGKWVVKELGKDFAQFDNCTSEWFCQHLGGYAGVFMRNKEGEFSLTWVSSISEDGKQHGLNVAGGKCSKL